jgi:hypothetical protein
LDIRVVDLGIEKMLTLGNNVGGGEDSCRMYIGTGEMKERKREEWDSKGTDRCPLTDLDRGGKSRGRSSKGLMGGGLTARRSM